MYPCEECGKMHDDSVIVCPHPDREPARERWDVHQHKDELKVSNHATIYHPEHGQLCICEKHWDVLLWHPIEFRDCSAAHKWIESGCIADLQEGLSNLSVGFSKVTMTVRGEEE